MKLNLSSNCCVYGDVSGGGDNNDGDGIDVDRCDLQMMMMATLLVAIELSSRCNIRHLLYVEAGQIMESI